LKEFILFYLPLLLHSGTIWKPTHNSTPARSAGGFVFVPTHKLPTQKKPKELFFGNAKKSANYFGI